MLAMNNDFAKDIRQSVADFYEMHGPAFARTRGFVWEEEKEIVKNIQSGMTIVDIGAGNGRFANRLPANVRYIGLEPSSTLRASATPSLNIRPGGFPQLDLEDAIADVTVCLAVLHHLPTASDREQATEELIRVTKSGGIIAATAWNTREPSGDTWVPWKAEGANAQRFVHLFSESEWRALWLHPLLTIEHLKIGKNFFVLARKK